MLVDDNCGLQLRTGTIRGCDISVENWRKLSVKGWTNLVFSFQENLKISAPFLLTDGLRNDKLFIDTSYSPGSHCIKYKTSAIYNNARRI